MEIFAGIDPKVIQMYAKGTKQQKQVLAQLYPVFTGFDVSYVLSLARDTDWKTEQIFPFVKDGVTINVKISFEVKETQP